MAGYPWILNEELQKNDRYSATQQTRYATQKQLLEAVARRGIDVVRTNKYTYTVVKKSVPKKIPYKSTSKGKLIKTK